jgi:hypothetical protein
MDAKRDVMEIAGVRVSKSCVRVRFVLVQVVMWDPRQLKPPPLLRRI